MEALAIGVVLGVFVLFALRALAHAGKKRVKKLMRNKRKSKLKVVNGGKRHGKQGRYPARNQA